MVINVKETGEEVMEAIDTVVLTTTAGHMICVTTKVLIEKNLHMAAKKCDYL